MDDRVEKLERRVAELEALVRQLAARALPSAPPAAKPTRSIAPLPRPSAPPAPSPPRPAAPVSAVPRPAVPRTESDLEQWIGQRGLLAVGILALLATAGFFVKYAIDQGWISPWVRVNLGALAGVGIAVWGDRLASRGLRVYGAAIVGGGGGVAYLAVWAASAEYALISPVWGLAILTGIAAGVAARAVHHRVEALAVWALAGAYGAPFFVPTPAPNLTVLLAFLFVVGVSGAAVAVWLEWRGAFAFALAGYFLIPAVATARGDLPPGLTMAYLTIGGMAALVVTEVRRWPESRFSAFLLAWAVLIPVSWNQGAEALRWLSLAAGIALTVTIWLRHCVEEPFGGEEPVEAILFVATPVAFLILSAETPAVLDTRWELIPLALALLYFLPGWPRRSTAFVAMGFALVAIAMVDLWALNTLFPVGWGLLGLTAVAADRWANQPAVGLWLIPLAALALFAGEEGAAFTGAWARAWYVVMACAALGAVWWRSHKGDGPWLVNGGSALWTVAGLVLFAGGTREIDQFFNAFQGDAERARLMGNLAISAFWILYAGTLVQVGFWLGRQPVRGAGLAVAGLAVLKIAFYDLSNLEALYRVASFFVLAVITLAVAYAYHRRAKASAT